MANVQCGKGHFYDNAQHSNCPFCGVDLPIGPTVARVAPGAGPPPLPAQAPVAATFAAGADNIERTRAAGVRAKPARDKSETVAIWNKKLGGIDPVVGWLVCIQGPDKGRDYRIHTERNFIGRGESMDICIAGDDAISRENHSVISYNPKRHSFNIAAGDGRGLTYVNDDELLGAQPLRPYDIIELGASKLVFVPFCGEHFTWPEKNADA